MATNYFVSFDRRSRVGQAMYTLYNRAAATIFYKFYVISRWP